MKPKLFDSHLHLADDLLYPQWEAILHRAFEACVDKLLVVTTNVQEMERALLMREKYRAHLFVAASITPHEAHTAAKEEVETIFAAAKRGDLDALGETGLEYFYLKETAGPQLDLLERSLQVAQEADLPVIFHCREAFADLYPLLDKYKPKGTTDEVKEVLKRGLYISLSGIVTYKKSQELRETAKLIPLDQLLIETDAPFLAPQAHRGKTNEPAFIVNTLSVLSECLQVPPEQLAEATYNNCLKLLSNA